MSMIINYEKKQIEFIIPNSEAHVNAQHNGIIDRSVGSYYMSEKGDECIEFLNHFDAEFFIDILICYNNGLTLYNKLKDLNCSKLFKQELLPQKSALETLEWMIKQDDNFYYKIPIPTINENNKYLKLDNSNDVVDLIKTLILGDLTKIIIKKIGSNGFVIFFNAIDNIDDLIKSNKVLKWIK